MNKLYIVLLSALLLSIVGCHREDMLPTAATISDAGIYRLDSRAISCQASATSGYVLSDTDSMESISVQLDTPSALSTNTSSYLILSFYRSTGQHNAPYRLNLVTYFGGDSTVPVAFPDNVVATLHETSLGVVSGNFTSNKPGQHTFSEGSFTNVHVKPPANVF
jgi:hypothetical protein